jgi:hypothetical protein
MALAQRARAEQQRQSRQRGYEFIRHQLLLGKLLKCQSASQRKATRRP